MLSEKGVLFSLNHQVSSDCLQEGLEEHDGYPSQGSWAQL